MPTHLPTVPFIFIRHGETDWNREQRTMGQTDIPLNALGIQQAHKAVPYLQNLGLKRILHSPLSRTTQTAQIINEQLQLPIHPQDNLQECSWGIQEGRLKGGKYTTESWVGGFTAENAEPYTEFRSRAIAAIAEAIQEKIPTLIVSHGGLFWALMDILNQRFRRVDHCRPIAFRPPEADNRLWTFFSLDPFYDMEWGLVSEGHP